MTCCCYLRLVGHILFSALPLARPFKDGLVVAAQTISIIALFLAWFWWVTFLISAVAMTLLQIIGCYRQNKNGFLASAVTTGIAGISCLFAGIWILVVWKDVSWCTPFIWNTDDDYSASPDFCNEVAWAFIAFVDMVLWLIVTALLLYFAYSGRYQKWEEQWGEKSTATGAELPNVKTEGIPASKDRNGDLRPATTV